MLAAIVNAALNNYDLKKKKRTLLGLLIIVSSFSHLHYIFFNHFEMVTVFKLIQTNVELRGWRLTS